MHREQPARHKVGHEHVLIVAFQGWGDAGNAASSALEYLRRGLDLDTLHMISAEGYVDMQMYRPMLSNAEDGTTELEWPDSRLLGPIMRPGQPIDEHSSGSPDRVRTLDGGIVSHMFLFDATEPSQLWRTYTDEFVEIVENWDIDLVVILGSMFADAPHSRPISVAVTSMDPQVRSRFDAEESSYEGPIGITTVISRALVLAGVPSLSLWAQVPHYVHSAPSPKATLAIIDRLEEMLDIVIPRAELLDEANEWERNINLLAGQDDEMMRYIEGLEVARDTFEGPRSTGDAIAHELERFLQIRPEDNDDSAEQ